MTTKKDLEAWGERLQNLAKNFGEKDKTEWLKEYTDLKQAILNGCSLNTYSNGVHMSNIIISALDGHEYLAMLFAKMQVFEDVIRGLMEDEK